MKLARACAGMAVAGVVTFGVVSPAFASTPGPIDAGHSFVTHGGQVDVLTVPYSKTLVNVVVDHTAQVKVGGATNGPSYGGLGGVLADPLPAAVCVLCHPTHQPE